jgi:hypothetical protein
MSSTPTHLGSKPEPIDDETERVINERLDALERDKTDAKPWPEVRDRILQQLKRLKPA